MGTMLHVRMVSPPAVTGQLVETLAVAPGISNVVVQEDAACRPDGDAVQFDVRDDAAKPVFAALRDLGLDHTGVIAVERVEAALTDRARPARRRGAIRRDTAPVWEMVEAIIGASADYAPSFYLLLITAALIGAVGILTNSAILIVAAMVVGPEYNAIIAVALGISQRHRRSVRDGLLALVNGFAAAIVAAILFGLAVRFSGRTPDRFLAGQRPVADLINSPDVFSVIVAVLAGLVGVVSLTESRVNALIGVFISVTTIPAAASVGLSIAFSDWEEARGSALQLLLNVVLLIAVGAGGLSAQRRIWRRHSAAPAMSPGQREQREQREQRGSRRV